MSKKKNLKILIYGILLTCSIFSINIKAMEKTNENKIIKENYENNYLSEENTKKIEEETINLISDKNKIENLMKTNYELLDSLKNIDEQKLINLDVKKYRDINMKHRQIANEILT